MKNLAFFLEKLYYIVIFGKEAAAMSLSLTAEYNISQRSGSEEMPSMHYHDSYELYFLEAGSREYFVEDSLFSVSAGDFVLIAPGMLHRTGGEYGMRTLISFTEDFLLRFFSSEAVKTLLTCFSKLKITPSEQQLPQFRGILQTLFASDNETDFALNLGCLLRLLGKCESTEITGNSINDIVAYINRNFGSISQISQISDQFYISRFHLCRIFKEAMKMTVVDYLTRVRIKNACHYLRCSDKDMNLISQLCGFHDPAYFSNVFKRQMGMTPSQYRKEK